MRTWRCPREEQGVCWGGWCATRGAHVVDVSWGLHVDRRNTAGRRFGASATPLECEWNPGIQIPGTDTWKSFPYDVCTQCALWLKVGLAGWPGSRRGLDEISTFQSSGMRVSLASHTHVEELDNRREGTARLYVDRAKWGRPSAGGRGTADTSRVAGLAAQDLELARRGAERALKWAMN